MKGIIVYKTKYGSTKQYADWIKEETGFEAYPVKEVSEDQLKYTTIAEDLKKLCGRGELTNAILLLHTPPYETNLDRVAPHDKMIDHVPMDVHILLPHSPLQSP